MSQPHRSVVPWLFAATVLASAPSASVPAAGPPAKAREVVTQGGVPATPTPLERAKAAAHGIVIPAQGAPPNGARFEWRILRQERLAANARPEHRTMEPRP